VIVGVIPLQS